jgi:hypothetical protein
MADRVGAGGEEGYPVPVIVLAEDVHGWRDAGPEPRIVTLFAPQHDAKAFTREVLQAAIGMPVPPTPCVYVPGFTGQEQALVIGTLVAAGAVALTDDDLNLPDPPHSPVEFAQAVERLHREVWPEPFRPFDDGISGFAPGVDPLPPPDDPRWSQVSDAAYESVVQRSAEGRFGGWRTAD